MSETLLPAGTRVEHPSFGKGRILSVYAVAQQEPEETEYLIKWRNERYPAPCGVTRFQVIK
jgi:hypothetical protein